MNRPARAALLATLGPGRSPAHQPDAPARAPAKTLAGASGWCLVVAACLVCPGFAAAAPEAGKTDGVFVKVASPVTSLVTNQVKSVVEKARTASRNPARVIVFDFNPGQTEAFSPDFGPCHDLTRYIGKLAREHGVQTVAFVHRPVSGHTVLPVLACTQVVMGTDAKIGPVAGVKGGPNKLDELEAKAYETVAGSAKRAAVAKTYDRDVRLAEGTKDGAKVFLDDRRREENAKAGVINIRPVQLPTVPAAGVASYPPTEARTLGLCQSVLDTHREVAEAYGLAPESLRGDLRGLRPPEVWQFTLSGRVGTSLEETLRRRVTRALNQRANVLIFKLECGQGDTTVARRIADYLMSLGEANGPDGEPVRTIAYIDNEAPDTATFIALGCAELAMAPNAKLGDFDAILRDKNRVAEHVRDSLADLAKKRGFPEVLVRGMFDQDLVIKQVQVRGDDGAMTRRILTEQELLDLPAGKADPNAGATIKEKGQALKITGAMAHNLNLALQVNSPAELYASYGFDPDRVRAIDQDWLENFASFLRRWEVTALLVLVGIGGMVLELKMPGFGAPGVISAVCFVLFFWAHYQYGGQLALLAGLLFLLGLVLLAIEVFILPGFGVTGVSGIVLIIVGLGMATMERMPQTTAEWASFGSVVSLFGGLLIGGVIGTFLFVQFLPYIPVLNKLYASIAPPAVEDEEDGGPAIGIPPERAALLGQFGTATTVLRPAGMARFGDELIDVVTDGGFIREGSRVQVVELEGNRVVVKEV